MDMAERYGSDLRRWLASAERFSESAMRRGLLCLKTLRSSDFAGPITFFASRFQGKSRLTSSFEELHGALVAAGSLKRAKCSQVPSLACGWIELAGVEAVAAGF
jgi:hypothetical protein